MKYLHPFKLTILAVLASLLSLSAAGGSVHAQTYGQQQKQYDELSEYVNRAKGLTLSILRKMKTINVTFRTPSGNAIKESVPLARQKLVTVKMLVDEFGNTQDEIEERIRTLNRSTLSEQPQYASELSSELERIDKDMTRYQRAIEKVYDRAIRDFGKPASGSPAAASATSESTFSMTGEVNSNLGTSSYKRPNVSPEYKQSTSDFGFGASAKWVPNERLNVNGNLSYRSTVNRRAMKLFDFGLNGVFNATRGLVLSSGLKLGSYNESDTSINDFKDVTWYLRGDLDAPGFSGMAILSTASRSYSELSFYHPGRDDSLSLDYKTTSFLVNGDFAVGAGLIKTQLRTISRGYSDYDRKDHKESSPSIVWEFSPGGSQIGFEYQSISIPNKLPDDTLSLEYFINRQVLLQTGGIPQEEKRIKAHAFMGGRAGGKVWHFGPRIVARSFPDNEDANFTDYFLEYDKRSYSPNLSTNRFNIMYRNHSSDEKFDFLQMEWRTSSMPSDRGWYRVFNFTGRFYPEESDESDSLRFFDSPPAIHDPHTAEIYFRFGLVRPGVGFIDRLAIGPILGAKGFFDTERDDDVFKELMKSDVDYIGKNPMNWVRVGGDMSADVRLPSGLLISGVMGYERLILYNSDQGTGRFFLKVRSNYRINARIILSGNASYHKTRASVESLADLDKLNINAQVRYLFDLSE